MYQAVYTEVNLLCALILVYILCRMRNNPDHQAANLSFMRVLLVTVLVLLLDSAWILVDRRPQPLLLRRVNQAVNALYLFGTGVISYCWLWFAEDRMDRSRRLWRRWRRPLRIPLAALGALAALSPWTGWLFSVDAQNVYHRGPLYFLQPALAYFYLVFSACRVEQNARRTRAGQRNAELLDLLSFSVLPAVGGLFTIGIPGLPALWPLGTLSLLMVYVNMQDYQISTDSLTGLNNRRQFDARLRTLVSDSRRTGHLTLFLMDIDRFKSINDTYGHYEGDNALAATGALLKKVARGRELFLARYGGDEFAILCTVTSDEEIRELRDRIDWVFRERNRTGLTPYAITLSVGAERFGPGYAETIPELIAGADRALYAEKQRRRSPEPLL
jgi:diguanylate cyclase (GGDEF)-like protein